MSLASFSMRASQMRYGPIAQQCVDLLNIVHTVIPLLSCLCGMCSIVFSKNLLRLHQ